MKEGQKLQRMFEDMGHPQKATAIQTDNTTAVAIANKTLKTRRSRPIDMQYYWIQDRIPKEYTVSWASRKNNYRDFFTKYHPPKHVMEWRPKYLHCPSPAQQAKMPSTSFNAFTARVC